jgi:hypothetical protein
MVLFVLGIVYTILFFMALANTYNRLFKCIKLKMSTLNKVFICFYWSILVQIILSDALYWTYFTAFKAQEYLTSYLTAVSLIFLPTILMIISYCLMYFQLEQLMKRSRIQSGQLFMRRFKGD